MIPNKKKTWLNTTVLVGVILVVTIASSFITAEIDRRIIASGVELARLSIDTAALEVVQGNVALGGSVMFTPEYQKLVGQLRSISKAFPIPAQWSYIATQAESVTESRLAVLTIQPRPDDMATMPYYNYDISKYPAMQEALYGDSDIIVSRIVWDKTYRILTRTGFAKLYAPGGHFLGVLGVDMATHHLVLLFLARLGGSALLCIFILIIGLQLAQSLGIVARPNVQEGHDA